MYINKITKKITFSKTYSPLLINLRFILFIYTPVFFLSSSSKRLIVGEYCFLKIAKTTIDEITGINVAFKKSINTWIFIQHSSFCPKIYSDLKFQYVA